MTPLPPTLAAVLVGAAAVSAAVASPGGMGSRGAHEVRFEAAQSAQVPAYGARVEVVRVHAAVLDDDGPVTDLTASDFVIIDNGVEHEVALALTPAEAPIDVALVFDQSESIRQSAPTVKRDARAFLDALGPDDCAFVMPFQHSVGPGVWGPPVAPTLLETIDLTPLEGGTSLFDALMVGVSELHGWRIPAVLSPRVVTEYVPPTIEGGVGIDLGGASEKEKPPAPQKVGFGPEDLPFRVFPSALGCGESGGAAANRRRAMVVLSDGVDTTSVHTFGELLGLVYESDIPVFPVLIGNPGAGDPSVNRDMQRAAGTAVRRLELLAEATGGKLVRGSGSEARLRGAYEEIITILRGSYLLGYYPRDEGDEAGGAATPNPSDHPHDVSVRVERGGVEVFARAEYRRLPAAQHDARARLARGAELIDAGRVDGALAEARAVIAAAPEMWGGHFLAAAALWLGGQPAPALTALRPALRLAPGVAAVHLLAWNLHYELGEDAAAWQEAIRAQQAGADMEAAMDMLAARAPEPASLEARLRAPRIFVEGPRGDEPAAYRRLQAIVQALARAVATSEYFGLVRDPLAADYYLYIDADDVDRRRPRALESRLELYNYTDRRLWREDMDVEDLERSEQVAAAVARALTALEEWALEGRRK